MKKVKDYIIVTLVIWVETSELIFHELTLRCWMVVQINIIIMSSKEISVTFI